MKTLLFLALLLVGFKASCQDSLVQQQQKNFVYLMDSCKNRIGFGCGWAGQSTNNIYLIRNLIKAKRFDLIQKLLDAKNPSTQYLAVATLIYANKKKKFKMDSSTNNRITFLKEQKQRIPYCSGCTVRSVGYISSLFENNQFDFLSPMTKSWIKDSFKK